MNQVIREEELRDSVGDEVFEQILDHRLHRCDGEGRYWLEDDLEIILGLIGIANAEAPEP